MAIKGYTFYIDGVKVNQIPQESPTYTFTGLASNSSHTITVEAVDYAGNVSIPGELDGASTLEITPGTQMSDSDKLLVDAAVEAKLAATLPDGGCQIGIIGPKGEYYKAYGSAYGRALTIDDKMRWGSTVKMLTATLILRQVDLGHISLDDKLSQYITGVANGDKITIKDLLMMRSGIPDYLQDDQNNQLAVFISPTVGFDPLPKIRAYTPLTEPNVTYHYSNSNFFLLGKIIEQIDATYGTGRPWAQIVKEDFCTPAGMLESGIPTALYMDAPYSRGFMGNPVASLIQSLGIFAFIIQWVVPGLPLETRVERTSQNLNYCLGTGDIAGTIHDAVKYGVALRDGLLLDPDTYQLRKELFETGLTYPPTPRDGDGWSGAGLGLMQFGEWYGWIGAIPAYAATIFFNIKNGAVVVVLMNDFYGPTWETFLEIRYALFPDTVHIQPTIRRGIGGIASGEAFGTPAAYVYHTPGDADAKTDVPLKVPFYI